ncbi:MAG: thioredoxin-disulfide reductase [Oscillospiraceae bacterium]|nr:thioredoxin-disulfide reductase [Oscillospiraceae bacterium]
MEHIYDILIIGGGPAGYSAALYAARAGLDTLLTEKMSAGGQMTLTGDIDNYPGFENGIDGFTLGMKMQQGAERFGAKTEYAEVTAVELNGRIKRIDTTSGSFSARSVIIAAGANPRRLGIDGETELTGQGVHYCAHCDGRFYKGRTVVVVGGGNSAAADALYLSRLAAKVYVVHRRDKLRAEKIYHEPLFKADNIEFIWNSTVSEFILADKLTGVKLKSTIDNAESTLPCDAVFVSIGRKPASEIFSDAIKLDENGYIIADESTKTNLDGVYAAGDIRTKSLRQVVTAVSDGAAAVHHAQEYLAEL